MGCLAVKERYDRISAWCESACSNNPACAGNIKDYIKDELYQSVDNYNLHYCLLLKNMPREKAINIFIDTNQNGIPVTKFEIVTAHADGAFDLDIRKSINEFCNSKQCDHIPYYFSKDEEKRVAEIGEWVLKVACLLNTITTPDGFSIRRATKRIKIL